MDNAVAIILGVHAVKYLSTAWTLWVIEHSKSRASNCG